ncbi:hypothetical protein KBB05_01560 [Patescibacteria group bacterium]|nr:hypothetical protein [Patescibacteria group bacterium]
MCQAVSSSFFLSILALIANKRTRTTKIITSATMIHIIHFNKELDHEEGVSVEEELSVDVTVSG